MDDHEQVPEPMRGIAELVQDQIAQAKKKAVRREALSRLSEIPMSGPQASREKARLLAAVADLATRAPLKVGDVVCWRPDLKNCIVPLLGQPAVVVEVINPPLRLSDPDAHGCPVYGECCDVRIAVIHPEDDRITAYAAESWRLQRWVA